MVYDIRLGTRLVVAIPTLSSSRRSPNWINTMASLQMPLGSSMARIWIVDDPIADARNALCKAALDAGVEYLFFLGDDVLPPPNVLLMMLDKIGRTYTVDSDGTELRVDMITGIYWTKSYPPEPYIFNRNYKGSFRNWKAGEFFPIDLAGCDCLLLDLNALRDVPMPWFSTEWKYTEAQTEPSPIATEDFYFYNKMRAENHYLFADTAIQCLHEDRGTGLLFGLSRDMVQAGGMPAVGEGEVLVADLGSGLATPERFYGPNAKIVRFDQRADVNPDVRCDIRRIDAEQFGKYDYVCASHVLEHFRRTEAPGLVKHWCQLLKAGGKIVIAVPNFDHAIAVIRHEIPGDINYAWAQLYGDQAKPGAAWQHLNAFSNKKLRALLATVRELDDIEIEDQYEGQNLVATATLREEIAYPVVT